MPALRRIAEGLPSVGFSVGAQTGTKNDSPFCWRTTKPVTSSCVAPAVATARTARDPGTFTDVGAVTLTPLVGSCTVTDTLQAPVPPPASVRATVRATCLPTRRRPNVIPDGAAKIRGSLAVGR